MHPAVGVDDRGRIAGRAHPARPDRVHVVGHVRGSHASIASSESSSSIGVVSASTPSLIAATAGWRTTSIMRRTQSRSRSPVAVVGEHAELDDRVDVRIVGAQPDLAVGEHAHRPRR